MRAPALILAAVTLAAPLAAEAPSDRTAQATRVRVGVTQHRFADMRGSVWLVEVAVFR